MTSVAYVWNKREWVCSVKQGTWKFQLSGVLYSIALQWTTVSIRLLNAVNDWSESESNPSAPSSAHSTLRGLGWKKEEKVLNCVVPEMLAPYTDPELYSLPASTSVRTRCCLPQASCVILQVSCQTTWIPRDHCCFSCSSCYISTNSIPLL